MLRHVAGFEPAARQPKVLSVDIQPVVRLFHRWSRPAAGLPRHAENNVGDAHLGESRNVMDELSAQYLGIKPLRLFHVPARQTDMVQVSEAGSLMLRNSSSTLHGRLLQCVMARLLHECAT